MTSSVPRSATSSDKPPTSFWSDSRFSNNPSSISGFADQQVGVSQLPLGTSPFAIDRWAGSSPWVLLSAFPRDFSRIHQSVKKRPEPQWLDRRGAVTSGAGDSAATANLEGQSVDAQ